MKTQPTMPATKTKSRKPSRILATSAAALLGVSLFLGAAHGQQIWDTNGATAGGAGNGNWDLVTANWTLSPTGVLATVPWVNGADANFNLAGASIVTVNAAGVNVNDMFFNTTGYTIASGGGNVLNLVAAFPNFINVTNAGDVATFNVALAGAGGAPSLSGAGTVIFNGANTYTGTTSVNAGILNIRNATALGTIAAGTAVVNGAALEIQGGILVGDEALSLNGTGIANGGALRNISGNNTYGGLVTLAGNTRINSDSGTLILSNPGTITGATFGLTVGGAGNTTIQSIIGTTTGTITKDGTGTAVLSGANTYTGSTTISGGVLNVTTLANGGAASGVGASTNAAGNLVLNGGTLLYTGATVSTDRLFSVSTANGTIDSSGTGPVNFNNAGAIGFAATVGARTLTLTGTNSGGANTLSPVLGDNGGASAIVKSGANTWVLSGANTYTGTTTVNAGTLQAGTAAVLVGGLPVSGAFGVNSAVTVGTSGTPAILDLGGFNTWIGSLAGNTSGIVQNSTFAPATLTIGNPLAGGPTTTFAGKIQDATANPLGILSLTKVGTFTQVLSGQLNHSGTTSVLQGILQIGDDGVTTTTSTGASAISVGATAELDIKMQNGGTLANFINMSAVSGTVHGTNTAGKSQTLAGVISGSGTFQQTGAGKTIMTNTNSYNGATTVAAGVLQVDGVLTLSSVTVNSGGTLGGVGTINQTVTVLDGGTLAPGDSPGTITMGTLVLNSLSSSNYELNTPGVVGSGVNDLTIVNNNLTLDGVLNVTNGGAFSPGAFRLFNYGTLTNNTLNIGTVPAGYAAANFLVTTNINHQVNLIVLAGPGAPVTQYWDGTNNISNPSLPIGGVGSWENFNTNWTTVAGTPNSSWQNGIAVFGTTPGLVTLADDIHFKGLQFDVSGYQITGAGNTLVPTDTGTITVNGTLATIATIDAKIVDGINPVTLAVRPAALIKDGAGTLILTNATNSYSGGTSIDAGRLSVTLDGQLGTGNLTFNGNGELLTDGSTFATAKTVTITATNTGRLSNSNTGSPTVFSGVLNMSGATLAIGSAGNTGVVTLTPSGAAASGASVVTVDFGTLRNGNSTGFQFFTNLAASTTVAAGATLDANGFNSGINNLLGAGLLTNSSGTPMIYTIKAGNFTGVIEDGASQVSLTKTTAGLLSLGGQNTYSGVTEVNAGILQATAGTTFDGFGNAVGGAFSPNSDFTVKGTGILELNGNSNTIQALNDGGDTTGIVRNNNVSFATLTVGNNNATGSYAGLIQDGAAGGALELTKIGTGTQTLSNGGSTYTGATVLNEGTLILNANSTPNDGSAVTSGPIGTAELHVHGGTVGSTTINNLRIGNVLEIHGDFSVAPRTGGVGRTVRFNGFTDLLEDIRSITNLTANSIVHFGGEISNGGPGSGGLTLNSDSGVSGFLYNDSMASRPNTYTGPTTVNANAFLALQKLGTNNAIQGDVWINPGGTVGLVNLFPDQIADTSMVTVNSLGIATNPLFPYPVAGFDLNGNNETIGSLYGNGTVQLNDFGIDGSGGASLAGIFSVGAGNFSGVISDAGLGGQLTKYSPGTLTLTGANTYVGNTNINAGTLIIDGSVRSATVFINGGGTLMGTGIAFNNVVNSGVFSPGHSPGTFTIGGNYTQTAAGTLIIEIAGKGAGQHDLVAVGGKASLDGNLRLVRVGGAKLKVGDKVTFLTAGGGVSGKFANVSNPFSTTGTIVTTDVVYHSNSVALEAQQGSFADFARFDDCGPNAIAVGRALDSVAFNSSQKKLINFLNGESLDDLCRDFDLISPDELASIFNIGISLARVQSANLLRRMDDLRAGAAGFSASGFAMGGGGPDYKGGTAYGAYGPAGKGGKELRAPEDNRIGVFVTGVGEFTNIGNTSNARGYDLTTGGFTIGVDYRVTPNFAIGINTGYARTGADLSGNGRVTVDGAKLGLYATYFTGTGFYVDAAASGGYNSYDTQRSALQGRARGSTEGGEFNALFATGYDWKTGGLSIGPTANVQYTNVSFDGFREHGSLAPLNVQSKSGESLRTALGMKVSYDIQAGGVIIRPEVRAAWQHEFGDSSFALDSRFANGAGNTFTVRGPEIGEDSLLLGAGVAVLWNERTSTYVYYDGELGRSNYDSNNVSGGVRMSF